MCCEGFGRASSVQACGKGLFSLGVWVARTCSGVFQVYWFKFLLLFFSLFFITLCLFWFLFLLFFLLLFRAKCTGSTFRGSIRCRRLWCGVLWASARRVRAFRRQCGKFLLDTTTFTTMGRFRCSYLCTYCYGPVSCPRDSPGG